MTSGARPQRRSERHVLVVFLNGDPVGDVYQASSGSLRFVYSDEWRRRGAYPLSLSMPLASAEHGNEAISAFLWGLLPDNERTLDQYGRLFGVSPRNPVALLGNIGADCAGAVQCAIPDAANELDRRSATLGEVEWLSDEDVAKELKSVREQGIPGSSRSSVGQFSLAGAQPKIGLLEQDGKWGRPSGRIPTNRILKPPAGEFKAFAENEHFCLELARALSLGSVTSRIVNFSGEVAIVVDRYDRLFTEGTWRRIHQEDVCQALAVMPTQKYESEGGPGVTDIIGLIRDASTRPEEDVARFLRAMALNWVLAATDAHAKNYALLLGPQEARLAPFYDIVSFLPYADDELHRVKSALKIGSDYLIRRINRNSWSKLARESRVLEQVVFDNVLRVLDALPSAVDVTADKTIREGSDADFIEGLRDRIMIRVERCLELLRTPEQAPP